MVEYIGYFEPSDSKAFEIIKAELKIVNPSLKMIKGNLVRGLTETKVKFENTNEYDTFVKRLINRGLIIKPIQ